MPFYNRRSNTKLGKVKEIIWRIRMNNRYKQFPQLEKWANNQPDLCDAVVHVVLEKIEKHGTGAVLATVNDLHKSNCSEHRNYRNYNYNNNIKKERSFIFDE